jgi:hypothetical protein
MKKIKQRNDQINKDTIKQTKKRSNKQGNNQQRNIPTSKPSLCNSQSQLSSPVIVSTQDIDLAIGVGAMKYSAQNKPTSEHTQKGIKKG